MNCPGCGAENDPNADVCFTCGRIVTSLTQGSVIASRYEIRDVLGKGGMGTVFRAFDQMLEEDVAIKVLRGAGDDEMARRFRSEIKLARRVSHPNVCRIHDYGVDGHLTYISMALLQGADLKEQLAEHPAGFPADEAFDIAIQAGQGLHAIHEVGIVHRDLKTPNLVREADGKVLLMDFGIAKETQQGTGKGRLTATGSVMGTPEYMSPEQARGEKVDLRSDVYALGIVVFELFTGHVPFQGDSMMATLFKHIQEPPPLEGGAGAGLPEPLVPVLRRALAKAPDDRYQSVGTMVEALQEARERNRQLPPPEPSTPASSHREGATVASAEAPDLTSLVEDAPKEPVGERRRETRLQTPINVLLVVLGADGTVLSEERTILDNISRHGARVLTALDAVKVGDGVALREVGGDFETRAVVTNAHRGGDGIRRLGLEFQGRTAPVRLVGEEGSTKPDRRGSRAPARSASPPQPAPAEAAEPAWDATPARARPAGADEADRRRSARLEMPLDVRVTRLGPDEEALEVERTLAENISRGGIRVMTAMTGVAVGDVVGVEEVGGDFETRAVVRGRYTGSDKVARLNVKFLDRSAPDRLVITEEHAGQPRRSAGKRGKHDVAEEEPAKDAGPSPEALRRQIIDAYQRRTTKSHFEVLGVPRTADERQVRDAYARLARQFHPDAARDPALADLKAEINAVFIRLGQARDVLTDPQKRARHESELGRARKEPAAAPEARATQAGSEGQPRPRTDEEVRAIVEEVLSRARALLASKKPWDAIQAIESALPIAGGNVRLRHQLQLLLARAMIENPKWVRRAEDLLRGVIQENSSSVEAHLALGTLYEANGLRGRARRAFQKVLEIDPKHPEARERLEALSRGPQGD